MLSEFIRRISEIFCTSRFYWLSLLIQAWHVFRCLVAVSTIRHRQKGKNAALRVAAVDVHLRHHKQEYSDFLSLLLDFRRNFLRRWVCLVANGWMMTATVDADAVAADAAGAADVAGAADAAGADAAIVMDVAVTDVKEDVTVTTIALFRVHAHFRKPEAEPEPEPEPEPPAYAVPPPPAYGSPYQAPGSYASSYQGLPAPSYQGLPYSGSYVGRR
uniref:Uncharacterized protein n=1 Tax=Setaria digitata TaxID=48799 RepID=A0A915Q750_9BILA